MTNTYFNYLTDPENSVQERLLQLLKSYPIDHSRTGSHEFIMHLDDAVRLVHDLEVLGIAVIGVTVWCYVAPGMNNRECCPGGFGGPSNPIGDGFEWFSEYVHLGFYVDGVIEPPPVDRLKAPGYMGIDIPFREKFPSDLDLANRCNPLVREYLEFQLPKVRGFSELFRVSLYLYIPNWELFPADT